MNEDFESINVSIDECDEKNSPKSNDKHLAKTVKLLQNENNYDD